MALELDKMHTSAAKAERVADGTYMARISSVIELGVQPMTDYQTKEPTAPKPRLLITWELPTETMSIEHNDGTVEELPRLISKEYTASAHEKANLTKLIASLKPGIKSLTELLDLTCMLSVGSTSTGNAKVANVVPSMKGMPVPELSREAYSFDFDAPDEETFLLMPPWIRTKLIDAENYTGFAAAWGVQEEAAA